MARRDGPWQASPLRGARQRRACSRRAGRSEIVAQANARTDEPATRWKGDEARELFAASRPALRSAIASHWQALVSARPTAPRQARAWPPRDAKLVASPPAALPGPALGTELAAPITIAELPLAKVDAARGGKDAASASVGNSPASPSRSSRPTTPHTARISTVAIRAPRYGSIPQINVPLRYRHTLS